jgi:hypothetical protein
VSAQTPDINISMVENGLDFILKSLQTVQNDDEDLKYSLLNLHAGTQLLLKEILYREHWSLIFQKIETAKKEHLRTGDLISVTHDTLIDRLKKICEIELDKNLLDKIGWLRKERNKAEHYQFVVSSNTRKSNIAQLLSYLIPFIKDEMINEGYIDSDNEKYTQIKDFLHTFDDYINERLKRIEDDVNNIHVPLKCPVCNQVTVNFIDETDAHCYFREEDIDNFTEEYIYHFVDTYSQTDGGFDPLNECPECGHETFISLDGYQFVCLTCGVKPTEEDLTTCDGPRCNGIYVYKRYEDEAHFCNHCSEYFSSTD